MAANLSEFENGNNRNNVNNYNNGNNGNNRNNGNNGNNVNNRNNGNNVNNKSADILVAEQKDESGMEQKHAESEEFYINVWLDKDDVKDFKKTIEEYQKIYETYLQKKQNATNAIETYAFTINQRGTKLKVLIEDIVKNYCPDELFLHKSYKTICTDLKTLIDKINYLLSAGGDLHKMNDKLLEIYPVIETVQNHLRQVEIKNNDERYSAILIKNTLKELKDIQTQRSDLEEVIRKSRSTLEHIPSLIKLIPKICKHANTIQAGNKARRNEGLEIFKEICKKVESSTSDTEQMESLNDLYTHIIQYLPYLKIQYTNLTKRNLMKMNTAGGRRKSKTHKSSHKRRAAKRPTKTKRQRKNRK